MGNKILVALNDSLSSRTVLDYIGNLSLCPDDLQIILLHVFRKPSGGEELMGKKYMNQQPAKYSAVLEDAKQYLVNKGFFPENIENVLVTEPYPTIAEGIIEQVRLFSPTMVIIGRKRMSKAEEFVMGDVSIKLVRALEGTAVLVVKM
ncbi:MAG: universal stress protein [Desulfobacteraceae bacterium]|jgi:nucleotide-binding universal stress UspA family protein